MHKYNRCAKTLLTATVDFTNTPTEQPQSEKLFQYGCVKLSLLHKSVLDSKDQWLDDSIITATQNLLKRRFPLIGGVQATILGENLSMESQSGEYVQILCIPINHWICVSTVSCQPSTIDVYDSLHGYLYAHTQKLVADVIQSEKKYIDSVELHGCTVSRWSE